MSGIEVAGLILGAIPVIVYALDRYKVTRQKWTRFKRKSLFIDSLIRELRYQKVLLESDITLVLQNVDFVQADIRQEGLGELMSILQRSDVKARLEEFFGGAYQPYVEGLQGIERTLQEIFQHIKGLLPNSQCVTLEELSNINKLMEGRFDIGKKIRFSIEREGLERQILDIKSTTDVISKLRQRRSEIYQRKLQGPSKSIANIDTFLQRVQGQAHALYIALSRSFNSSCHERHEAKFYLDSRSAVLEGTRASDMSSLVFKMMVTSSTEVENVVSQSHELSIRMLDGKSAKYGALPEECLNIYTDDSFSHRLSHQPKLRRSVSSRIGWGDVQSICVSLQDAQLAKKHLEVYLSHEGSLSCRHIPHKTFMTNKINGCTQEAITLAQILLDKSHSETFGTAWGLVQRTTLSFHLASALLQLCATPWLAGPLTKERICFLRLNTPPAKKESLTSAAEHPFMVSTFPECPVSDLKEPRTARSQLLDLGIILLELWHGYSIEQRAARTGSKMDLSQSDRCDVARSWLDDSASEIIPSYHDAALRCVNCEFPGESSHLDWKDQIFRKAICEGVITPLWILCKPRFK